MDQAKDTSPSALYDRQDKYRHPDRPRSRLRPSVLRLWIGLSLLLALIAFDLSLQAILAAGTEGYFPTFPPGILQLLYLGVPPTSLLVLLWGFEGMRNAHPAVRRSLSWRIGRVVLTPFTAFLLLAAAYGIALLTAFAAEDWTSATGTTTGVEFLYAPLAIVPRLIGWFLMTTSALALRPLAQGRERQAITLAMAGALIWFLLVTAVLIVGPVEHPGDNVLAVVADGSASLALSALWVVAIRVYVRAGRDNV